MKNFIIFLLLFSCMSVSAQTDSSHLKKIPFVYMKINSEHLCSVIRNIEVIQTDADWINAQAECGDDSLYKINFNEYVVMQRSSMGDCHAKFTHLLFMDTVAKKIIWEEHNYDGGCRGARFQEFRIMFRKPPAGYTFEEKVILEKKRSY